MHDALGDRMKSYERAETARAFLPTLPVYARIDGRGFSRFTRGMERPFCPDMHAAMVATVGGLVDASCARIGYTQSDEISLAWRSDSVDSEIFFGGKAQKMCSVLAGMATALFTRAILTGPLADYADRTPHFDCRVFQLPSDEEAANAFLWREIDATKNAVSMAAHHYYSHKALQGVNSAGKQDMLHAKGVNFNDYPAGFKRGTYVRRVTEMRTLTEEERLKITPGYRPAPEAQFERSSIRVLDAPPLRRVANRADFIMRGADPVLRTEETA